jgi:hypothetical protein
VALVLLAVAGGADMLSGIFRMTIPNAVTPDRLRVAWPGSAWWW